MEESYDPDIRVVYMPFFEAEITKGGNSQITRVFCVYRICQFSSFFLSKKNLIIPYH